jgi:hypothetical protein
MIRGILLVLLVGGAAHAEALQGISLAGLAGTWKTDAGKELKLTVSGKSATLGGEFTDWKLDSYDVAEGKLIFTRTPKAAEMNPKIPEAARREAEGRLQWKLRLDVDAHGDACRVALGGKLYPGKVEWTRDPTTGDPVPGGKVDVTAGSVDTVEGAIDVTPARKAARPVSELGRLLVTGSAAGDVDALRDLIEDCATRSPTFAALLADVKQGASDVTLRVGRGQPDIAVDAFRGNGTNEINLDHLETFACTAYGGHRWTMAAVPAWATSRCEILTHILDEARRSAIMHVSADKPDLFYQVHTDAIRRQILVRREFGQPTTNATQTFEKRDGIKIQYGASEVEHLEFDGKRLVIQYH